MWDQILAFFDAMAARYRARRAAQAQADLARGQAVIDAAAAEQREMDAARPPTVVVDPGSLGPVAPHPEVAGAAPAPSAVTPVLGPLPGNGARHD